MWGVCLCVCVRSYDSSKYLYNDNKEEMEKDIFIVLFLDPNLIELHLSLGLLGLNLPLVQY